MQGVFIVMKNLFYTIILLCLASCIRTSLESKTIFIPKDLQDMNLADSSSTWSYSRMDTTENLVIFWEKGFGNDLSHPDSLEGQPMDVDLPLLRQQLEHFYTFFRDTLQFTMPDSRCHDTRMMVMLRYSLEGTAYGGSYDDSIGALWVTPQRLRDPRLNCIAHELGHSFQCQIGADRGGEWPVYGFYEMTSQWMLWQVNPDWLTDENYHYEAYRHLTHLAFLHTENIYHSPYVLQYWSEKHGRDIIARLFKEGRKDEDPVQAYQRLTGITHEQFCDEMIDAATHIVGLDFQHAFAETRKYAYQMGDTVAPLTRGEVREAGQTLEAFGFDVFPLNITDTDPVEIELEGMTTDNDAAWRYGFVQAPDGRRWLVVMATPKVWHPLPVPFDEEGNPLPTDPLPVYPYRLKIK